MNIMKYIAIIEIPKGSNRRIHMAYDKSGFIDLGSIKDRIPVNDGVMPVDYGFLEGTFNKDDKDEVDVLVFSKNNHKTGDRVEVTICGILRREDGDHKIIAHDNSWNDFSFEKIEAGERKTILDYMGHLAKIKSIGDAMVALAYIEASLKN